ncbi:hypothetical protein PRUPE_4G274800 [Prunus persica]|uniref:Uncharacterized protein n=1 Tax=Prunus persica TaxID=3760 RepID=A0A251PRV3_PRUPE|nr:NAD-specific glutamate dehydrogenase-like [Prunus persica]ONI14311.1 hypothetical protein PRUPE_4G274800 [Prunus persica]
MSLSRLASAEFSWNREALELLLGGDIEDTIVINIKGNIGSSNTLGTWRKVIQDEFAQKVIIRSRCTLTFINGDSAATLVIKDGGGDMIHYDGNSRVSENKNSHGTFFAIHYAK